MIIYCYGLVLQKDILLSPELVTVMGHILVFSAGYPIRQQAARPAIARAGLPIATSVQYFHVSKH